MTHGRSAGSDQTPSGAIDRLRGIRAEEVASWYLRVNGFLAIPGFIVHLDSTEPSMTRQGRPRIARTEADFVAVRFPYSRECVDSREMIDDPKLVVDQIVSGARKPLFVLAEVKAGQCDMNGPWTDRRAKNMQRVIRRMGFTNNEEQVEQIAGSLYDDARWEGANVVVQYVCFGSRESSRLTDSHKGLVQITWIEIGQFLHGRHASFPEKTPGGFVHAQWPQFGREFARWFARSGRNRDSGAAGTMVDQYVSQGGSARRTSEPSGREETSGGMN